MRISPWTWPIVGAFAVGIAGREVERRFSEIDAVLKETQSTVASMKDSVAICAAGDAPAQKGKLIVAARARRLYEANKGDSDALAFAYLAGSFRGDPNGGPSLASLSSRDIYRAMDRVDVAVSHALAAIRRGDNLDDEWNW